MILLFMKENFKNGNIDTNCRSDYTINNEIDINNVNKIEPTKFTKLEIEQLERVEIEELINDESEVLNLYENFLPKGLAPLQDIFV